jgi:uncharacterized protein YhjY with autotransporter beta-barrel domain
MNFFKKPKTLLRTLINSFLLCAGISSNTNGLIAQTWQEYPQPIGTLAQLWNVSGALPFPVQPPPPAQQPFPLPTVPMEELNYICAQWDSNMSPPTVPFDINYPATQIISTQSQHFVRLYAPGNAPNTGSGPNGAWFMRSEYVRGLTPEQLKDRFALQAAPTMITNVEFPASPSPTGKNYGIFTGIAGPIATWGNGGGLQNRTVADFNGTNYFPNYAFTIGIRDHQQPIGAIALSYAPMAGNGNTGHVAHYLDQFIPAAYSDLENVYTNLDYLNWIYYGPDPLVEALNQISPERYGALSFVVMRNALLFANTFLDFRYPYARCPETCQNTCECDVGICSEPQFGLQGVAEQGKERSQGEHPGFNYYTGGAIANVDFQLSREWMIGANTMYMDNKIDFHQSGGSAHLQTVKGGLYASYDRSFYFIDGMLSGGYNWGNVRRTIEFLGVDRDARSHPNGFDVEAHLQYGVNVSFCEWCMTPLVRASYFYVHQKHCNEHGADSLDLSLHSSSAQTLRTVLGAGLTRAFCLSCVNIIPQVQLAWAHDFCMDNRTIKSNLTELGGSFPIHCFHGDRNSFLGAAQLTAEFSKNVSLIGRYDAEVEKFFLSQAVQLSLNWNF